MTTTILPPGSAPDERVKEELLRAVLVEVAAGREDSAAALLTRLVESRLDLDARASDLTFHVFAAALGKRLRRQPHGVNLYLQRFDLSQISLFNLLAEHLPLVRLAGGLANDVLGSLIEPGRPVALLDVGIGTGQQEVALIHQLAARKALPSRLHMIAVEPSVGSLQEAERRIRAAAAEVGLELEFTGIDGLAEELDDAAWASVSAAAAGVPLVVNAAFAAHHVQGTRAGGPVAAREALVGRLASLAPQAVVLCEPSSDHQEPDLARRFEHCWRHYGTVFRLIDRLDLDDRDRSAMKLFFAREIDDVLATEEDDRTERHEPVDRWLDRLNGAGLQPASGFDAVVGSAGLGVEIVGRLGYAGLTVDRELIVAVICAAPGPLALELTPIDDPRFVPVAVGARATSTAATLRVRDVMETEVATISADATMGEAADVVWRTGASDLAVLDEQRRFVGVLSEGDLIRRLLPAMPELAEQDRSAVEAFELLILNGHHAAAQPIEPLVIRDPVVLAPTDDLLLVAHEMVARQIRRLPVVTEERELVGSVSRADLCHALLPREAPTSSLGRRRRPR